MKKKILLEALRSDSLKKIIDDLTEKEDFELIGWVSRKLQGILMPFIDIYEEEGFFVVVADLPGFSRENLEIEVVEGEKKIHLVGEREKKITDYIEEGRAMKFEKDIRLPNEVTGEGEAKYENGVLTIKVNKKEMNSEKIKVK